ncbi:hypothetical protein [Novosphingobium mathurense]|uniref:Uncharacterized protein n=1 Tax=Novosphingobium mathurense TaxID=428990 RepID=A0A1U6IHI4_9SPHN|nr:hypothetical protein [Novosphingobium mathurense]SLK07486.1 hypothetical protein SAMN06295987_106260 [Novosphingobium mathurense]
MPTYNDPIRHRQFVIKAMAAQGGWRARALRGLNIASPTFDAADRMLAIEAVRAYLDGEAEKRRTARGPDGVPAALEFAEAFEQIAITDGQKAMLDAHLAAPGHILTATQLAHAAGYASYEAANAQYGLLARALAEELEWTPAEQGPDGHPIWTFTLATEGSDDEAPVVALGDRAEWRWRLRPQVVEALSKR